MINENSEKELEKLKEEVERHKHEGIHKKEIEVREKEIKKQEEEVKEAEKKHPKLSDKKGGGSFMLIFVVLIFSVIIASLWEKIPEIKNSVHYALDPSAGALLNWNLNLGMLIIVSIITLLTTIVQKYATDQKTLKELRAEQKEIQKQMKEFKNHPEKLLELQKRQFKLMPKQMKLSMRALVYTGVPFILFFRWFTDYFSSAGNPKLWLGMSWFLFYLLFAIIFGAILRKQMDVV